MPPDFSQQPEGKAPSDDFLGKGSDHRQKNDGAERFVRVVTHDKSEGCVQGQDCDTSDEKSDADVGAGTQIFKRTHEPRLEQEGSDEQGDCNLQDVHQAVWNIVWIDLKQTLVGGNELGQVPKFRQNTKRRKHHKRSCHHNTPINWTL